MGQALGYIIGGLSGLAVLCTGGYALEQGLSQAERPLRDTQNFLRRRIDDIREPFRNILDIGKDSLHDLVQRNPGEALEQLDRWAPSFEHTPYQDYQLSSTLYENGRDFLNYLQDESQERLVLSDYVPPHFESKGGLILGLSGLGLGILGIATLATIIGIKK